MRRSLLEKILLILKMMEMEISQEKSKFLKMQKMLSFPFQILNEKATKVFISLQLNRNYAEI